MSGETEKYVSGWTVDTLKEYVERRFTDQDEAVQSALLAAKEAVIKAETAAEKRFEATNEFRAQLTDQTATFISRNENEAHFKAIEEKVTTLTDRINVNEGLNKGSEITIGKIYAAIAAAAAIAVIAAYIFK